MKQLMVLVRREFWENRSIFVVLPAVITGFFLLILLLGAVASPGDAMTVTIDVQSDEEVEFLDDLLVSGHLYHYALMQLDARTMVERTMYINAAMQSLSAPLLFSLWFVIFFYLLGSLYDDRKDRSVLFWKSLPVSDAMTVVSKLLTGLIVVPLVYLAGVMLLQLSALIFVSISASGTDISAVDTIWRPAALFSTWTRYIGLLLFYGLWALPFFGWLLVVSAYAKSAPLAWAAGIPIAIRVVEAIFTDQTRVGDWMQDHIIPISFLDQHRPIAENAFSYLFSLQMLSALVVGGAFIYLAIWLRGKADEI
ncbi:MAG: hypothetical protein ISP91_04305 [Pseudomonadales bacterium]|jgi:ABC-2 type transport system permease protein|nr:hypothetical protein [Pseudomonadales bacterium]